MAKHRKQTGNCDNMWAKKAIVAKHINKQATMITCGQQIGNCRNMLATSKLFWLYAGNKCTFIIILGHQNGNHENMQAINGQ